MAARRVRLTSVKLKPLARKSASPKSGKYDRMDKASSSKYLFLFELEPPDLILAISVTGGQAAVVR